MARLLIVGEGMLELSANSGSGWQLGYGGDTLNMAIHLARFGHHVSIATALGTDRFSTDLCAAWSAEGVDTSLISFDPKRLPGMYAIRTDESGERSFSYWRSESAARQLFSLPDGGRLRAAAEAADLVAFSLISLAILSDEGREALLDLCGRVRARGGRVAFDGNYRSRLWRDSAEARHFRDRAIAVSDIGLPTLEDEQEIAGTPLDPAVVTAHWAGLGAKEIVVKLGADGCSVDGVLVAPIKRLKPVDTSGAGDAFNAGYLHARLSSASPLIAAESGHRIASWVLLRSGAIPTRTLDAPYEMSLLYGP